MSVDLSSNEEDIDLTESDEPSPTEIDLGSVDLGSVEALPVRELPQDLRSALQIATTPSLGLPILDSDANEIDKPASVALNGPAILTVDVLGSAPQDLSGLFTDVLTDNGFSVDSVTETSILLTRDSGTVTIAIAEDAAGCLVEVRQLPASAIKKLILAGMLQIGFEIQASRPNETVLRNEQKSLVRIVSI